MSAGAAPSDVRGDVRSQRFPALDGIRALAAFAVVLTHVGFVTGRSLRADWLGPLLSRGDFGVTVFFLLSGFLLYRPFALRSFGVGPAPLVAEFFWRRALRILPALWLVTALVLAFVTVYHVRPQDWAHYLLLIQTYDHHDYDPNLSQLWTLSVEVSFYALLPILARLVGGPSRSAERVLRRQVAMLLALAGVALAFNVVQSKTALTKTQALLWLPGYLDWFALGMGLAVLNATPSGTRALIGLRRALGIWSRRTGTCWSIAGVLFLITTLPVGIPRTLAPATFWEWTSQHYLYGAAAFFIMLPLVLGGSARADTVLGSPVGRYLGNVSYSVYLWHVPVMLYLQRKLGFTDFKGHFLPLLASTAGATLLISSASWLLIERPILRYGSRPWRGAGAGTNAASAPAVTAAMQSS